MTDMNLESLVDLILKLKLHEPRPLAIWFVDRSALFYWLLRVTGDEINHLEFPFRFYGLLLHNIAVNPHPAVKYYKTPLYQLPGVWVEMSDGNHLRLADG